MAYYETRVDARDLIRMARESATLAKHCADFGDTEMAQIIGRTAVGIAASIKRGRQDPEARGFRLVFKEGTPP